MLLVYLLGLVLSFVQCCHAIKCYDCNSEAHPSCGDPFDPANNDDFLRECVTPKNNNSVPLCRKIEHTIKDHHRIVRSCGWIEYKRDCYITGSEHYRTYVCACKQDECNSVDKVTKNMSLLSTLVSVYFIYHFLI